MRMLLSTYGSRGDVEPMAALATSLLALGAEARLCAPPDQEFVELAARAGAPFAPAFMPVRRWIAEMGTRAKTDFTSVAATMASAQYEAIAAAAEGCDAVVATGLLPSTAAALSVSQQLGIAYAHVAFCPLLLPSPHHRPFEYPGHPYPPDVAENQALWDLNAQAIDELFGEAVNSQRASIGLPPLGAVRDRLITTRPWLASDPVLSPWRRTGLDVVQTGAWILPDERPLSPALAAFLEAGEPPVYVGFGSMGLSGAPGAARAAIEAVRALGLRVLIARGWADLAPIDDGDDCFVVGDVNQQALFGRTAAVVHHGGAGTTTAAARAGAPQVVVPQVVDQPYWAGRVAELGVGAAHDGPTPTTGSLSEALAIALDPETRARAVALAGSIRADGAAEAAKLLLETISR